MSNKKGVGLDGQCCYDSTEFPFDSSRSYVTSNPSVSVPNLSLIGQINRLLGGSMTIIKNGTLNRDLVH